MIHLSQETEALALRLAAAQRVSVEDAIRQALEARARVAGIMPEPQKRRDQSAAAIAARQASVRRIVEEVAALPVLDTRSAPEIIDELNAL
jgi:hypothetical protein